MALPHLTDEEIRTWTPAQKDRWWLENVYRGNMPQLTLRSAVTGFFLGGVLSATNLYIGAKTGWTLGVGVTSVILSFVIFRTISKIGVSRDMTILENNAVQSIATAAGYMTGPLISALMAYMFVTNTTMEWHKMLVWNVLASLLGVLVAFPMKRRFINDEQQPFPEGRACAVVLDSLYPDAPKGGTRNMVDNTPAASTATRTAGGVDAGLFKAKALAFAAALGAGLQLVVAAGYMAIVQIWVLGTSKATDTLLRVPERLDEWYYDLAAKHPTLTLHKIKGLTLEQLGVTFAFDLSMIGAGGLMGMRIANSVMLGMILNFLIIAPIMITNGEIMPRNFAAIAQPDGSYVLSDAIFGRAHLTNAWCLWWGVAMMVTASMIGLFAKPKMIFGAFAGMFSRKEKQEDCLRDIELPLKWSFIGVPILAAIVIYINHEWFGVSWWLGALSIPLIIVLTLIAANATALTSTTPTGSLSKITQFTFGAIQPTNPGTNLMTAGVTTEVASNASNLLMDIKPGYMLGAKPRQQAWGHCIGIVAGALASTPLFFLLFLWNRKPEVTIEQHVTDAWAVPGALQWSAISKVIEGMGASDGTHVVTTGVDGIAKLWGVLPVSAAWAMLFGAVMAAIFEILRIVRKGKFPLSAVGIGLGVVLPPESTIMMWLGAAFFSFFEHRYHKKVGTFAWRLWVDSKEAVCAGLIAGWALLGIGDGIIAAFATFSDDTAAVIAHEKRSDELRTKVLAGNAEPAEIAEFVTLTLEPNGAGINVGANVQAMQTAATAGNADAHVALGDVAKAAGDFAAADAAYGAAAAKGSKEGNAKHALLHATHPLGDRQKALSLLPTAAESGNAEAQFELAELLLAQGGDENRTKARALLASATEAGNGPAAARLFEFIQGDPESAERSMALVNTWLTAVKGGQRDLGKATLEPISVIILASDDPAWLKSLATIAERGSAGAVDMALAKKAFLRGHEIHDPELTILLARFEAAGTDGTRDDAHAAMLLSELAKAGNVKAMEELGEMLARIADEPEALAAATNALGVNDGVAEARRLWTAAAESGSLRALFNLGWLAKSGLGGAPSDVGTAKAFWKEAADRGDRPLDVSPGHAPQRDGCERHGSGRRALLAVARELEGRGRRPPRSRASRGERAAGDARRGGGAREGLDSGRREVTG
jgi:OPT family oligopeptide transporter